jgi:hypothetical protein
LAARGALSHLNRFDFPPLRRDSSIPAPFGVPQLALRGIWARPENRQKRQNRKKGSLRHSFRSKSILRQFDRAGGCAGGSTKASGLSAMWRDLPALWQCLSCTDLDCSVRMHSGFALADPAREL